MVLNCLGQDCPVGRRGVCGESVRKQHKSVPLFYLLPNIDASASNWAILRCIQKTCNTTNPSTVATCGQQDDYCLQPLTLFSRHVVRRKACKLANEVIKMQPPTKGLDAPTRENYQITIGILAASSPIDYVRRTEKPHRRVLEPLAGFTLYGSHSPKTRPGHSLNNLGYLHSKPNPTEGRYRCAYCTKRFIP